MESAPTRFEQLPFYSTDGNVILLWSSGVADGRALADACLGYMREHDAPTLLGQVAKAQILAGSYGRTEIAFWHRIAEAAA